MLSKSLALLNLKLSQGSVATHSTWGGSLLSCTAGFLRFLLTVKNFEIGSHLPTLWWNIVCPAFSLWITVCIKYPIEVVWIDRVLNSSFSLELSNSLHATPRILGTDAQQQWRYRVVQLWNGDREPCLQEHNVCNSNDNHNHINAPESKYQRMKC